MTFDVFGRPAPQGSKRYVGGNRASGGRFIEASKYLPAWRQAVKEAAIVAKGEAETLTDAVEVSVSFFLERPKSITVTKRPLPIVVPDLSKLIRAIEDSMTDAGVWADDSQVIKITAYKFYADDREPGCRITVLPYVKAL